MHNALGQWHKKLGLAGKIVSVGKSDPQAGTFFRPNGSLKGRGSGSQSEPV
jgi:hypothetical protein